jgi:hypothetical protein
MKHPVLASLIFTAGLAVGFLFMPDSPKVGAGVIIASCSVVLILSVRRAAR